MGPGDTVLFHPLLLHASGANLTKSSRRSISVHYASSTLCKWENFKLPLQIKIHKEIQQMAKIHGLSRDISEKTLWSNKSRQVCGDPGSLGTKYERKVYKKNHQN